VIAAGEAVIELRRIRRDGNVLSLEFDCDDDTAKYVWHRRSLEIYASGGVAESDLRANALFLVAFAPLAWLVGATLRSRYPATRQTLRALGAVGERVAAAYGLPRWKKPFDVPVSDVPQVRAPGYGLFLSGGVDSLTAALAVRDRLTSVLYVSDFDYIDDAASHAGCVEALDNAHRLARELALPLVHVQTTLAHVIRHSELDVFFSGGCSFWLGLQHVNHLAVAANAPAQPPGVVYVAGSVSEFHAQLGSCAADESFVASYDLDARLELVEADVSRQRKIETLLDEAPDWLARARVCYSSQGRGACADCGKCQGTALMILAGGGDLVRSPFPPNIVPELIWRIDECRREPPERNMLLEMALAGRALSGTRNERLDQLKALVPEQQAWATPSPA